MIAYFRLLRLPNVFSAIADILAGYFLATTAAHTAIDWLVLASLCAVSAALYLAGMAFNDIADRDEDARVRPTRPIPSGAVSLQGAVMCAGGLMLAGIQIAAWTGRTTLIVAAVLCAAILAYDFVCKGRTFAGPLALGVCRFANVLLGMSAAYNAPDTLDALRSAPLWGMPWLPALASGLYGAGVTAFSAQEEEGKKRGAMWLGWLFIGAGLVAAGAVYYVAHTTGPLATHWSGFVVLGGLFLKLQYRTFALQRSGSTDAARALVLEGVRGYCPLDAAMLLLFGGFDLILPALAALLLIFPGGWLRKWLAQREA